MIKRKANPDEGNFDEVSVTNLIDVLFVLLIMFMITASAVVHSSIPIQLPEVYTKEKAGQAEIELIVDRQGKVYLANNEYKVEALASRLSRLSHDRGTDKVVIKADGNAPYGKVMAVMDTARISGLTSLTLAVKEKVGGK